MKKEYCFTVNELESILDNKYHNENVRVIYEFNKKVYLFSDVFHCIHDEIIVKTIKNTTLFDSIDNIKELKDSTESFTTIFESAKKILDFTSFIIFKNNSSYTDNQFITLLVEDMDNIVDRYSSGFACKINDTIWAICREDEFNKVKQIPLFNNINWISLKNPTFK